MKLIKKLKTYIKTLGAQRVLMLAVSVCFFFVMVSSGMVSGLYAKYVTKAGGDSGARVIRFRQLTIEETGDFTTVSDTENQFVFAPGVPLEKNVLVTFEGSEAATHVFVVIRANGWSVTEKKHYTDSEGQLSWSVADGWEHLESEGNTHVYYRSLDVNVVMNKVPFIKNGEVQVSEAGDLKMYGKYPETNFSVQGYVVQANGFDSVADAWASLKNKT